jgi:hypothetical protein
VPGHPLLAEAAARNPGLRVPRTGRVVEALVPAVLEQKVTGKEARASFRLLVLRYGDPAPGPAPDGHARAAVRAETWCRIPSWEWHRPAWTRSASRTICGRCSTPSGLEQAVGMEREDAPAGCPPCRASARGRSPRWRSGRSATRTP